MKDKRTVTTDALETLGTIIGENEKRDAIHLAVEPATAGEALNASDHVRIENGVAKKTLPANGLGIVDPFLSRKVKKGEKFWLVVYPRQITSLRHVWEHPSFPEGEIGFNKVSSELWLRHFCETNDVPSYATVMAAIEDKPFPQGYGSVNKDDGSWTFMEIDSHCDVPDEFWKHVEIVLGRNLASSEKTNYFGCSC